MGDVRGDFQLRIWNCTRRALLTALASSAVAVLTPALASQGPTPTDRESLQGRLIGVHGGQPTLKTALRDYILSAKNPYLSHTLRDERLLNREIRVEGRLKPDSTFEVVHLFTVRDGKLYKVRYYCDICNIAALEPGNCVCCQRPTELQEIPLSEVGNDTVVVP